MRNAFGIMGLLCGAIVVALVARYGYKTTDDPADALIVAFLYAVIATFGLAGHAFAVYLWRHSKLASLAAGLIAVASLGLNLSNSLGAIAGRQDTAKQERISTNRQIRAAEAELKRLTTLRDGMPVFVTTDDDAAKAAKRAADAATKSREAECDGRGRYCRQREDAEKEANNKLTKVAEAKAATDRANKLEADAKVQRDLLAKLGPIVKVEVQGSALAGLFRLPDEEAGFLATAQQFGTAAIVELIILICLIGWEVSRPKKHPESSVLPMPAPTRARAPQIPSPPQPRLVATNPSTPFGSVKRILTDNLESASSTKVELADAAGRYRAVCRAQGRKPVTPEEFAEAVVQFCKEIGIRRRTMSGKVYLLDVQLTALADAETI